MPSRPGQGKGKKPHRPSVKSARKSVPKKAGKKPSPKGPAQRSVPKAKPESSARPKPQPPSPEIEVPPRLGDSRRHILSLAFVRDGDEFMARLETDAGQITELKNRFLDQLLTLVANELEDILE